MCGSAVVIAVKVMNTSPPITSVSACAPLLYGMWVTSRLAMELKSAAGNCVVLPLPAEE